MGNREHIRLGGISLDSLSDRLILTETVEKGPVNRLQTVQRLGRAGSFPVVYRRESLDLQVKIMILAETERETGELLDLLRNWARPGWLTLGSRPGKRLRIDGVSWGEPQGSLQQLTLTACSSPWWQATEPAVYGAAGLLPLAISVTCPGTAEAAPVEFSMTNTGSGHLEDLTLIAGETRMILQDLALAPGETLQAEQDEQDCLCLKIRTEEGSARSALTCRHADSSDELMIPCGRDTVLQIQGNGMIQAEFRVRGRWL